MPLSGSSLLRARQRVFAVPDGVLLQARQRVFAVPDGVLLQVR